MNIGFDISQTCESKSGTGFFADQMIMALANIDNKNQYTIFPWFYDYRPETINNATQISQQNFRNKVLDNFSDSEKEIKKLDIIHSNNFRFPYGVSAKKVVTIYDVCFMDCPEYTTEANRLFCYKGTLDSMLFADKVIAISNYTKERLLHFFPSVPEEKVDVVYCGNRDTLLKEEDNVNLITKFSLKKNEYFLSVGTIEPRKNYGTLLKAFKQYKEMTHSDKKLCIAGGYGWMQENFTQDIRELGLEKEVVVTGYVSDTELSNLYRYCFSFVYTTWYEGFGLPVLEAMNFGKPVIASNITSIPEVTGDSALLINPGKAEETADCMKRLDEDGKLYQELAEKAIKRSGKFSWLESANKLLEIYNRLF